MQSYPQHIHYSPAFIAPSAPWTPLSAVPGPNNEPLIVSSSPPPSAPLPSSDTTSTCCGVCCLGCGGCCSGCGSCQSCEPGCSACCAKCPGCSPGGCCSPTVCSRWLGAWSVGLGLQWLSFVLLLTAVAVRDWFWFGGGSLGLWWLCGQTSWTWRGVECDLLSYELLLQVSNIDLFQALRAFAIMSLVFTTASAILASIRLARFQQRKPISTRFERSTHAAGLCSLLCLLLTLVLSAVVWRRFQPQYMWSDGAPGSGFSLLCTAFGLMLLAVPLHAIVLLLHTRATKAAAGGQADDANVSLMSQPYLPAGGEPVAAVVAPVASAPPLAYTSSFPHPSPYYPAGQNMSNELPIAARYQVVMNSASQW